MIRPLPKNIQDVIDKLKTLKAKQTNFLNKNGNAVIGKADKITEELANKFSKLTFEQKEKYKVDTFKLLETLNDYEKIRIKPKEYWPDDIQSLINEVEKLMFPYGEKFKTFGESIKTGILPLDYIIQELEKIKYKIEVEAQQNSAEQNGKIKEKTIPNPYRGALYRIMRQVEEQQRWTTLRRLLLAFREDSAKPKRTTGQNDEKHIEEKKSVFWKTILWIVGIVLTVIITDILSDFRWLKIIRNLLSK